MSSANDEAVAAQGGGAGRAGPVEPPLHQPLLPPPSPPAGGADGAPAVREPLLVSLAGVAGNMAEWFDFACFGYFSDVIARRFFPPDQAGHAALAQSFAVFGSAFLARPLGGALVGQRGDRVGRKAALVTSLLAMAAPTVAMGCLPGYSRIGWGAPVLLAICRLLQGLSVGGQIMTSTVFTMERKERSRWGVWGGIVMAAISAGVTLGSLFSYVLRQVLTDEQLNSWGWRIPFITGGILAVIPGLYLKKYGKEHRILPPEGGAEGISEEECDPPQRQKSVIAKSFEKANRRTLLSVTMVVALPNGAYYIIFVWLAIFMESIADPPVPHAFAINTAVGVLSIAVTILGGWIADRLDRHVLLMAGSGLGLAAASPFLLAAVGRGSPVVAFSCQLALGALLCLYTGAMYPWIVARFPPALRLTSVSIGYNVAVCLFGGSAPAVATMLVDAYGVYATGLYVTSLAVLSMLGLLIAPAERKEAKVGGNGVGIGRVKTDAKNDAFASDGVMT